MAREKLAKGIRISVACIIAIWIADLLQLQYYVTAGIITILTIQETKKETLKSAVRRGMAFLCSIFIAAGCFFLLGYRFLAFALYLLFFIVLCQICSWTEAITIAAVSVSHFFIEQSMSLAWLYNETLLFFIGTGMGVLFNMLLLRQKEKQFEELSGAVDGEIRKILEQVASELLEKSENGQTDNEFLILEKKLETARSCAVKNYNNAVFGGTTYELDYVEMRQKQGMELEDIYRSIGMIRTLPKQAAFVSDYISRIVREYHRENDVRELLEELEKILKNMKQETLPENMEEFEARAVLFYILKQLEEFLKLKNEFVKKHRL